MEQEDVPGGPVVKILVLSMQEAWIRSLVREIDITCHVVEPKD